MNQHEADLLDQYLDALRHDPNAPIPAGLDPALAAFARELWLAEQVEPPAPKIAAKVWQRTLLNLPDTRPPSANGHSPIFMKKTKENEMLQQAVLPRRIMIPQQLTLIAALLTLVLFGGFFYANSDGGFNLFQGDTPENTMLQTGGGTEIPIGQPVNGTLTADAPSASYIVRPPAAGTLMVDLKADKAVAFGYALLAADGSGGGGGGGAFPLPIEVPPNAQVVLTVDAAEQNFPITFTLMTNMAGEGQPNPANNPNQPQPGMIPNNAPRRDVIFGEAMTVTLDQTTPAVTFQFVINAGQTLEGMLTSDNPVNVAQGSTSLPSVGSNMFGGGGGGGGGGGSPVTEFPISMPFTMPSQGEIIVFLPPDVASATVTLEVDAVAAPMLTYDTATTGTLDQNRSIQFYEFEAVRGEVIDIQVEGADEVDLVMRLYEPATGMLVWEDDDSGAGYNPEINNFQAGKSGTYRVEVSSINGTSDESSYTITVNRVAGIALTADGTAQEIRVGGKQGFSFAQFAGTAGETVRLTATHPAGEGLMSINVIQNGEDITLLGLGAEAERSIEFTVPADGDVLITIIPTWNNASNPVPGGDPNQQPPQNFMIGWITLALEPVE